MAVKVCKFGGTSMADGNVMNRVKSIIDSDKDRKFIVVSAPGKRYSGDVKVTDMLYECYREVEEKGSCGAAFALIRNRFTSIVKELNIDFDISSVLDETEVRINREKSEDFTASRGEYLSARVMAEVLGAKFIDAEDVIFFDKNGAYDAEKSDRAINEALRGAARAVFPGFYGRGADGKVKTFSRGGSDISGAIVARAVNATIYENWTDVSGFLACDPRIVESPRRIKALSYKELRELSYMGANVLHSESIFPVRKANIPIHILNTFRPEDDGTLILPSVYYTPSGSIVTGIAGKKDFTVIFIEKSLMNAQIGFVRKVLSVLEKYGVPVEHIPSGIDTMSVVVESAALKDGKLELILQDIKQAVQPDTLRVTEDIALIATVGHGMSSSVGTSARLFKAMAEASVNVRMIDQGSSELNIIVGVKNEDCEKCIKAIYREFFGN
ncbi:MAG TPA: aspartate kinase [Candidatus Coproplasma avistercoris]|nr:aspartate kinase [Candidatus Coproplasma avistercoris]